MSLPLSPPLEPQLARPARELPLGPNIVYEPKWDGFRVIAFVDGGEVFLQSRGSRPLHRYFPEIVLPSGRYVLDGEIVILGADGRPSFGTLQARLHPAESRIERLSRETPAVLVAFDLLALGDDALLDRPFADRRALLATLDLAPTPSTNDPATATEWLSAIEGVIAKELDAPYRPGKRLGMHKVKLLRSIDCVVVGYRPGTEEGTVGSLILSLYDDGGVLRVIGHSSGFAAKQKRELLARLAPYESGERGSGVASRWSEDKDLEWVSLRPELVAEVTFDHASGGRIRHGAKLVRFSADRAPRDCLLADFEPEQVS